MTQPQLGPGMLLVAARVLVDPHFADSVVLLIDADEDGALGVVLNQPTSVPIAQVLEGWEVAVNEPSTFFVGGPVGPEAALAVGSLRSGSGVSDGPDGQIKVVGFRPVSGSLGLVDLDTPVADIAVHLDGLRIFAGYSGWSAGQLEAEVVEGAWHVVPAQASDLFGSETGDLWRAVLRRQPGELAWASTQPLDPAVN